MAEAHTPGERVIRSPLPERVLVDTVNRIREGDHFRVAEDLLAIYHAFTAPCRPVFDQMMVRAYPAGDVRLLCEAAVEEQLDRLYLTVLEDLGEEHLTYDREPWLAERLRLRGGEHVGALLADIARDAVYAERIGFASASTRDDLIDALYRQRLAPTSVLLHVCETLSRELSGGIGPLPNPVDATVAFVEQLLRGLSEAQVGVLIDGATRSLRALDQLSDSQCYRAMVVCWRRGQPRRSQRPGTGFLTVAELGALFPWLRSLKVKVSEAAGRYADYRAEPVAALQQALVLADALRRSSSWTAGAPIIELAHEPDRQR